MEGIKFRLHPLFFVVGAISCLVGKLPLFLTFTLSALLHECAHALTAGRYGYQLNELLLMPYGAIVKGDLTGVGQKEELFIFLSGPFFSGGLALATLALWWLVPDCYPYTEDIFTANKILCLSNLLPVIPLDGGRIARVFFKNIFGDKRGERVSKIFSLVFAVGLIAYSLGQRDILAGVFYSFLLWGDRGGGDYQKMLFCHQNSFRRGVVEKRIAITDQATVKTILKFISPEHYLFCDVYNKNGEFLFECRQEQIEKLFSCKGLYAKIGEIYQ